MLMLSAQRIQGPMDVQGNEVFLNTVLLASGGSRGNKFRE